MTLRTDLTDDTTAEGVHAAQHNEVNAAVNALTSPPALLGIATSHYSSGSGTTTPAAASTISADLATVNPVATIFDTPTLFAGYGCLAEHGGTIIAGCTPAVPGTFIGHPLS